MKKNNLQLIPLIFDLTFKKMFDDVIHKERIALLISVFLNLDDTDLKNYIEWINETKQNHQKKSIDSSIRIKIYFSTNEKICFKVLLHLNQKIIDRNINSLERLFKNKLEESISRSLEKQIQINFTNHDFTKQDLKDLASKKENQELEIYHINVDECFHIYQMEAFQYYSKKMQQEILLGSLFVQTNRKSFQKILKNINMSQELKQEILKTVLKISSDQNILTPK